MMNRNSRCASKKTGRALAHTLTTEKNVRRSDKQDIESSCLKVKGYNLTELKLPPTTWSLANLLSPRVATTVEAYAHRGGHGARLILASRVLLTTNSGSLRFLFGYHKFCFWFKFSELWKHFITLYGHQTFTSL